MSASDDPASVSVPAASSYVEVMFVPPTTNPFTMSYVVVILVPATNNALTLSSTLSSV